MTIIDYLNAAIDRYIIDENQKIRAKVHVQDRLNNDCSHCAFDYLIQRYAKIFDIKNEFGTEPTELTAYRNIGLMSDSGFMTAGDGLVASTPTTVSINLKDTNPGLEFSTTGLGVQLKASNSGLEISSGLGVQLQPTSGLTLGATGLAIDFSSVTLDGGTTNPFTSLSGLIGTTSLATTDKSSLTAALNELHSDILGIGKLQIRNHLDSTTIPIDEALVGVNPTTAGEGLSNLNDDITNRANVVLGLNSMYAQNPTLLNMLCGINTAIANHLIMLLDGMLQNTGHSEGVCPQQLQCAEKVLRIASGSLSNNAQTIHNSITTKTECKKAVTLKIYELDNGDLKSSMQGSEALHGQLQNEICAQFDM